MRLIFLKLKLKKTDIVLDVGANKGILSIFFSKYVKQVYSFEPIERTYIRLNENIRINNINNIITYNLGLSNSEKSITFYIPDNQNYSSFDQASYVSDAKTSLRGFEKVTAVVKTLDSFDFEKVDVIKVDVEGAEFDVIKGASILINKCCPLIYIELTYENSNTLSDFIKLLNSINPIYKLYSVRFYGLKPISETEFKSTMNLVCIPSK